MSDNISKTSLFKKNVSKDNTNKGENVKNKIGKHNVLVYLLCLTVEQLIF